MSNRSLPRLGVYRNGVVSGTTMSNGHAAGPAQPGLLSANGPEKTRVLSGPILVANVSVSKVLPPLVLGAYRVVEREKFIDAKLTLAGPVPAAARSANCVIS